ncbi:MAG: LTA synthase family protein [Planctomycetota bacterium]
MTLIRRLPPRIRFALVVLLGLLVLMTALRLAFWGVFHATDRPVSTATLLRALFVGFKFDLRLALLLILPVLVLSWIPGINPAHSARARRFWAGHFAFLITFLLLFYCLDFGHYAYLETRFDVSSVRFVLNPIISFRMAWETYPLGWFLLGLVLFGLGLHVSLRWLLARAFATAVAASRRRRLAVAAVTVVLYLAGLYGKASFYPLRWSDAFFTTHRFTSDLALNPVLFFCDTLCTYEEQEFDRPALEQRYDRVAAYLGVEAPDRATLTFARPVRPTPLAPGRPNVVVLLMESFAAHSTGAFGNPLQPSPHFDALAREGLLFRRFYTPRYGTARAVFATVTGIPDTITNRTASRNPQIVRQYTIPAALDGYTKLYFLGGSANWANIRGLLAHNIKDLHIYEEGSYPDAPRVDVWGLSDLHLFEAANRVLRGEKEPFFAFIHLSGNHRPYTIPEDNRGFERVSVDEEELYEYGFHSLAEFNSFRFLDHSLGFFMRTARREAYFANTLFVLLGDNGTPGLCPNLPRSEEVFGLGMYHTPFLLYGPGLVEKGKVFDFPATQMDVMPTVAGAIGAEVRNTTMGRNLLDERFDGQRYAFLQTRRGAVSEVGLLGPEFYLVVNQDGTNARLHGYLSKTPLEDLAAQHPERVRDMVELGLGLYHASKYMMYHNAPPGDAGR